MCTVLEDATHALEEQSNYRSHPHMSTVSYESTCHVRRPGTIVPQM